MDIIRQLQKTNEEDKRKQRKRQADQLIRVVKSMNELVNAIRLCSERGFEIIGEVFKRIGEAMQKDSKKDKSVELEEY